MIEPPNNSERVVLIVEDDPWIRSISSELLEEEGFVTANAADGEDGLDLAVQLRPVAILLDLGLPHMSGTEFLRRQRGRASLRRTPVILVSGQPGEWSRDATALADAFLRKPVDLMQLVDRVQAVAATHT